MSLAPMINEMSTPTVCLEAQVLKAAEVLDDEGKYVPDISIADGFIQETQILKALALSNFRDEPCIKSVTMARSPITAAFKDNYFSRLAEKDKLPAQFEDKYGDNVEDFFVTSSKLKEEYSHDYDDILARAMAVYTYLFDRIGTGLQQLLAETRKWDTGLANREDLAALTERTERVTGVPTVDKIETDFFNEILRD